MGLQLDDLLTRGEYLFGPDEPVGVGRGGPWATAG